MIVPVGVDWGAGIVEFRYQGTHFVVFGFCLQSDDSLTSNLAGGERRWRPAMLHQPMRPTAPSEISPSKFNRKIAIGERS